MLSHNCQKCKENEKKIRNFQSKIKSLDNDNKILQQQIIRKAQIVNPVVDNTDKLKVESHKKEILTLQYKCDDLKKQNDNLVKENQSIKMICSQCKTFLCGLTEKVINSEHFNVNDDELLDKIKNRSIYERYLKLEEDLMRKSKWNDDLLGQLDKVTIDKMKMENEIKRLNDIVETYKNDQCLDNDPKATVKDDGRLEEISKRNKRNTKKAAPKKPIKATRKSLASQISNDTKETKSNEISFEEFSKLFYQELDERTNIKEQSAPSIVEQKPDNSDKENISVSTVNLFDEIVNKNSGINTNPKERQNKNLANSSMNKSSVKENQNYGNLSDSDEGDNLHKSSSNNTAVDINHNNLDKVPVKTNILSTRDSSMDIFDKNSTIVSNTKQNSKKSADTKAVIVSSKSKNNSSKSPLHVNDLFGDLSDNDDDEDTVDNNIVPIQPPNSHNDDVIPTCNDTTPSNKITTEINENSLDEISDSSSSDTEDSSSDESSSSSDDETIYVKEKHQHNNLVSINESEIERETRNILDNLSESDEESENIQPVFGCIHNDNDHISENQDIEDLSVDKKNDQILESNKASSQSIVASNLSISNGIDSTNNDNNSVAIEETIQNLSDDYEKIGEHVTNFPIKEILNTSENKDESKNKNKDQIQVTKGIIENLTDDEQEREPETDFQVEETKNVLANLSDSEEEIDNKTKDQIKQTKNVLENLSDDDNIQVKERKNVLENLSDSEEDQVEQPNVLESLSDDDNLQVESTKIVFKKLSDNEGKVQVEEAKNLLENLSDEDEEVVLKKANDQIKGMVNIFRNLPDNKTISDHKKSFEKENPNYIASGFSVDDKIQEKICILASEKEIVEENESLGYNNRDFIKESIIFDKNSRVRNDCIKRKCNNVFAEIFSDSSDVEREFTYESLIKKRKLSYLSQKELIQQLLGTSESENEDDQAFNEIKTKRKLSLSDRESHDGLSDTKKHCPDNDFDDEEFNQIFDGINVGSGDDDEDIDEYYQIQEQSKTLKDKDDSPSTSQWVEIIESPKKVSYKYGMIRDLDYGSEFKGKNRRCVRKRIKTIVNYLLKENQKICQNDITTKSSSLFHVKNAKKNSFFLYCCSKTLMEHISKSKENVIVQKLDISLCWLQYIYNNYFIKQINEFVTALHAGLLCEKSFLTVHTLKLVLHLHKSLKLPMNISLNLCLDLLLHTAVSIFTVVSCVDTELLTECPEDDIILKVLKVLLHHELLHPQGNNKHKAIGSSNKFLNMQILRNSFHRDRTEFWLSDLQNFYDIPNRTDKLKEMMKTLRTLLLTAEVHPAKNSENKPRMLITTLISIIHNRMGL